MKARERGQPSVVQRRAAAHEGVRLRPPIYGIRHADSPGAPLPASVQSKMERSLGADFSAVRVHEGMQAPAIGAQAFTRGSDLHFAPGQFQPHTSAGQRVIGHELAHVVQQSQGRARASTSIGGVGIDGSASLEHEAEQAGQRAAEGRSSSLARGGSPPASGSGVVQRRVEQNTFKSFLEHQAALQERVRAAPGDFKYLYTTVGFEHEFAQMEDGPLHGVDHVELSRSSAPDMPFTGIPFVLETDAANAVELVSPPFLLETKSSGFGHWKSSRKPVPLAEDVEQVDALIRTALHGAVLGERVVNPAYRRGGFADQYVRLSKTMAEMVGDLRDKTGIDFPVDQDVQIEAFQLSPAGRTRFDAVAAADNVPVSPSLVASQTLRDIRVVPSNKGGGITTQVNFATDALTADAMQREADTDERARPGADGDGIIAAFRAAEATIRTALVGRGELSAGLRAFYSALSRTLSGQIAIPYMTYFRERQEAALAQHVRMGDLAGANLDAMGLAEGISSHVKDTSSVWVKDMVLNLGLGLLERAEWTQVRARVLDADVVAAIVAAVDVNVSDRWPANLRVATRQAIVASTRTALAEVARVIQADIRPQTWWGFSDRKRDLHFGQQADEVRLEFAQHRARDIGPRQDTFIRSEAVQTALWGDRRLHVVETRADVDKALALLKKVGG
ncbi:DUF4157 domain-containing protein [Nannocystaceae bacterium ST9]